MAIDLKKLVIGSSEEENFSPNKFGRNRAFSSDAAGLEVASACFGGTGSSDESAWSALTLWFAMKGGDVYALCPLLPSKWQPSSTLVSSIWTATVASIVSTQKLDSGDSEERRQLYDQYEWICDIDMQDPMVVKGNHDFDKNIKIYSRPSNRSPVSRLQGPFQVFPEDADEDIELSDIHVIAGKYPTDETRGGDDLNSEADLADEHDLSAAMICLMTRSGRLYVCLDLEGVEGQWLPRTKVNLLRG